MKGAWLLSLLSLALCLTACGGGSFAWEDPPPKPTAEDIAAQARYDKLEKQKDALGAQIDRLQDEMDHTTDPERGKEIVDEMQVLALGMDEIQRKQEGGP